MRLVSGRWIVVLVLPLLLAFGGRVPAVSGAAASGAAYRIVAMAPPGAVSSDAVAINADGDVVGFSTGPSVFRPCSTTFKEGRYGAFLYETKPGRFVPLGHPKGFQSAYPVGISLDGETVVAQAKLCASIVVDSFIGRFRNGKFAWPEVLRHRATPAGVNRHGEIALTRCVHGPTSGECYRFRTRAATVNAGASHVRLLPLSKGNTASVATGIDEDGRVIGYQYPSYAVTLWNSDGTPHVLPDGVGGWPYAISEHTLATGRESVTVVGTYCDSKTNKCFPGYWEGSGAGETQPVKFKAPIKLPVPGYEGAEPLGVSPEGGVIVGQGSRRLSGGATESVALMWEDGTVVNLNGLLPADSGWTLTSAGGVDKRGDIFGNGVFKGQYEGFLLKRLPA